MSTLGILFALLVASYLGAFLLGSRGRAGGLASGSEWLALGFAVGPAALGAVPADAVQAFTPLALVGVGWLALGAGLRYGVAGGRRVPPGLALAASLGTLGTAALVALAMAALLAWLDPGGAPGLLDSRERLLVAGGAGLACAETARRSIRRVLDRQRAQGPLSDLLLGAAVADEVVVILGAALLFGFYGSPAASPAGALARAAAEVGAGLALGGLTAALLRGQWRLSRASSVLFGTSLVAVGLAAQAVTSVVGASFGLGLGLALLSGHAPELRRLAAAVERPVLLPVLLLAGARIEPRGAPWLWAVVAAAVAARFAGKALSAGLLAAAFPAARRGGAALLAGLDGCGGLGMAVALALALAFPGPAGATVLAAAAAATVAGEFVVPFALRAALRRAGEAAEREAGPAEAAS